MEAYFSNFFEDDGHEQSLVSLLALTDPEFLKQSNFTDDEIKIIKSLALEKLNRQIFLRDYFALKLIE